MWYAVAFFLMGGFRTARSLAAAHIRSIVSGANMGLAFGIAETTTAIALILAPALAGYLYDIEPVQMYSVSLGAIALSLIISFAAVFQRKAPRETEAPSLEPELVSIKTE
jgi:lipoprotein signal peptidase